MGFSWWATGRVPEGIMLVTVLSANLVDRARPANVRCIGHGVFPVRPKRVANPKGACGHTSLTPSLRLK
uniref:Putative secreted peptide n=1 Tax=Anopheles braziliensis TaxID=58242 RepID=A0A2M3ZWJ2_9DIPT